jgi:hypothetical protein
MVAEDWMLGAKRRLLQVNSSRRTGRGGLSSLIVFDCETKTPRLVFDDSSLDGVTIAEATPSRLVLLRWVWAEHDAHCCPSAATQDTYLWRADRRKYMLSKKVRVPKSAMLEALRPATSIQPYQAEPFGGFASAVPVNDLQMRLADPVARAEFHNKEIEGMRWGFPDLGFALKLDKTGVDRVLGVFVDFNLRSLEAQRGASQGESPITPTMVGPAGIPTLADAISAEFGPEMAELWAQYQDSLPARMDVRNVVYAAADADAPLSRGAREHLVDVYTRATRAAQRSMNPRDPRGRISPLVPALGVTVDRVTDSERIIAYLETRNADIRAEAGTFLSDAQQSVLNEYLERELRTHRDMLATALKQRDDAANSAQ